MRKLGQLFSLLVLSVTLQVAGSALNVFTMNRNMLCGTVESPFGAIALCRPVMPYLYYGVNMDDFRHAHITKGTHYVIFTDYIPVPAFYHGKFFFAMASVGDVLINVGMFLLLVPPFVSLYQWVKRRFVTKEEYEEEGFI